MNWLLSTPGIITAAILIIGIATLIYWKRDAIKGWFGRQKVEEVELGAGPVKVKLKGKEADKPRKRSGRPRPSAGVHFGEGGDFTGAKIQRVAGRDIRHGAGAGKAPGGKTPGVDFGKRGKFGEAEIRDVAGRDVVDTSED